MQREITEFIAILDFIVSVLSRS